MHRFIIIGRIYLQQIKFDEVMFEEIKEQEPLYAQRYFKDTFGVMATVGTHNLILPQILKKVV